MFQSSEQLKQTTWSAVKGGADGLWFGTCLGLIALGVLSFDELKREGAQVAGVLNSTDGNLVAQHMRMMLLYALGALVDKCLNIGVVGLITGTVWGIAVSMRSQKSPSSPTTVQTLKDRLFFWSRTFGILMLLLIVKVWPTPYAPAYRTDGSIDDSSRNIRIINRVQKWDPQKGWVSLPEFYKINVRPGAATDLGSMP
jgi:hypothetical protein